MKINLAVKGLIDLIADLSRLYQTLSAWLLNIVVTSLTGVKVYLTTVTRVMSSSSYTVIAMASKHTKQLHTSLSNTIRLVPVVTPPENEQKVPAKSPHHLAAH